MQFFAVILCMFFSLSALSAERVVLTSSAVGQNNNLRYEDYGPKSNGSSNSAPVGEGDVMLDGHGVEASSSDASTSATEWVEENPLDTALLGAGALAGAYLTKKAFNRASARKVKRLAAESSLAERMDSVEGLQRTGRAVKQVHASTGMGVASDGPESEEASHEKTIFVSRHKAEDEVEAVDIDDDSEPKGTHRLSRVDLGDGDESEDVVVADEKHPPVKLLTLTPTENTSGGSVKKGGCLPGKHSSRTNDRPRLERRHSFPSLRKT